MTNLQAYMAYYPDESIATLTLGSYAIDPTLSDQTTASSALAMIDMALKPDYKQGATSETMSDRTRAYLISRGKAVLKSLDITYIEGQSGVVINGVRW